MGAGGQMLSGLIFRAVGKKTFEKVFHYAWI
jgi:hypothetical protein